MAEFENYGEEARRIEAEIVRHGIALGIDWNDEIAVRALAREALDYRPGNGSPVAAAADLNSRARIELFGLVQLMLKVMTESASEDEVVTHGGPVWKAFARALWAEHRARH